MKILLKEIYPKAVEFNTLAEVVLDQGYSEGKHEGDIKVLKIIAGAIIRNCKKNIDEVVLLIPE